MKLVEDYYSSKKYLRLLQHSYQDILLTAWWILNSFYQSIFKNFHAYYLHCLEQFTDLLKNVIFANNQEACIAEGLLKEFYPLRVFPAAFSSYSLGVGVCVGIYFTVAGW